MTYHRRAAEEEVYPDEETRGGWRGWVKNWFGPDGNEVGPETDESDTNSIPARRHHAPAGSLFPLTSGHRQMRVSVRLAATTMDDAQQAVDSLKDRAQVVLNLEKAPDGMDRRILDFVSGACYALDGGYQRVGAKVFLFAPSNVYIDVEDDRSSSPLRQPSFLSQEG